MPEPAHLAEAADDVDREAARPLVLVDDRRDLLDHEVADRLAEQGVLRREIEVHRPESTATDLAPPRRSCGPPARVLALRPCLRSNPRPSRPPAPSRAAASRPSRPRRACAGRSSSSCAADGPSSPEQLATMLGRQPDRRPPAAPLPRGRRARRPADRPSRRRPPAPPVRRDPRRPDRLSLELRRARGGAPGRGRHRRRRRARRPGLRRPAPAHRRAGEGPGSRSVCRPARRSRRRSGSWR